MFAPWASSACHLINTPGDAAACLVPAWSDSHPRRNWSSLAAVASWAGCLAAVLAVSPAWGQAGGDFPHDDLLKALTTGSEAMKRTTLSKLNAYGEDPRVAELLLKAVKKAPISGVVPESSLEMLFLLGTYIERAEVASLMWKCLESTHPKVVMIAVDCLGELGDTRALDRIIKLVESPHYREVYGFRKGVIAALIKIKDPRSVDTLIAQLADLTGQLQYDVVRYLAHISRQRFGTQSELWETWWTDNKQDFQFNETTQEFTLEGTPPSDFVWDQKVSNFFGTDIYAKRLIFVLDVSSSMTAAAGAGPRIELAKQELANAIANLPEDTSFAIILFDGQVAVHNRNLIQATEATRKREVAWVQRIQTGKGTNSFDALKRSFSLDGNAEAVFFLSDGMPTSGEITDPALIVQVLTRENFFRRIAIYGFGFAMGDAAGEQFMKGLAERNNGAYKALQ